MIYTVTLNPSLDYVVELESLKVGGISRALREDIVFGGKGINVSHMLKNLGMDSCALGFIAGFSGEALRKGVQEQGINTNFLRLPDGFTRINVKVHGKEESEINGQGPLVDETAQSWLLALLKELKKEDVLVLSGSLAKGMHSDFYARMLQAAVKQKVSCIVDTAKEALLSALPYHPFLIKPNHHELGELFDATLTDRNEILSCAERLQKMGARNVLVSMAEQGALLLSEQKEVFYCASPKGKIVNSVGAGDSMVAGFVYGWQKGYPWKEALRLSVACGSASAFSKGIAEKELAERLLEEMEEAYG